MGKQPQGTPGPLDGSLPPQVLQVAGRAPMGLYLHVPFCATRCGYCDFNTYTASELGSGATVSPGTYGDLLVAELQLASRVLQGATAPIATVFLGGGTPNLLPSASVAMVLEQVSGLLGRAPTAEVTIEANPDSVDPPMLAALREAGCNRISLGMQSAVPRVLATLDRTHTPGATAAAVRAARAAGFQSVSVDLIYGTPGESLADWQASLAAAVALDCDHVSAYALIVEDGTRMAVAVRKGWLAAPDDDLMADMYLAADDTLSAAGLGWYELSNWSRPGHECRHNLGYWHGHNWWGAGPGAHSHVSGIRWWNQKHPAAWAEALAAGRSPAAAREVLGPADVELERLMLQSRLATGVELAGPGQVGTAADLVAGGLAHPVRSHGGRPRLVLTRAGRLLADGIVLRLLGEG